jgi:DNA-binding NarL/FixJ family response regulator
MSRITIVLADDHPVVLAGVKALLGAAEEMLLVGEATTGPDALALICERQPDIAVIDISLPELGGIDLAQQVGVECPAVKLLVLTVHEDRAYVQPLLQAGVRGYLLKRSAADELIRAIRAIAEGGIYLDPAVAEKALFDQASINARGGAERQQELSQRESEVLRLTAQGFSNKEIAGQLEVSVKTIETHKARALEKLHLRTRAEIVRYGVAHGWLNDLQRG